MKQWQVTRDGFYIHNPHSYPMYCEVTAQTQYQIINWEKDVASYKSVTREKFIQHLEQYTYFTPPFWVVAKDGYVQSIREQYIP